MLLFVGLVLLVLLVVYCRLCSLALSGSVWLCLVLVLLLLAYDFELVELE